MKGLVAVAVAGVAAVVLSPPAAEPRAVPVADPPLERATFSFPPMAPATTTTPPPTTTTVVVATTTEPPTPTTTTTNPPTTTTSEPELGPAAGADPEPEPATTLPPLGDGWEALIDCESGGDPQAVSPDGTYTGLVQFDRSTWASVGGSGRAGDASPAEQLMRARMLYAARGAQPWPVCGRHLR